MYGVARTADAHDVIHYCGRTVGVDFADSMQQAYLIDRLCMTTRMVQNVEYIGTYCCNSQLTGVIGTSILLSF